MQHSEDFDAVMYRLIENEIALNRKTAEIHQKIMTGAACFRVSQQVIESTGNGMNEPTCGFRVAPGDKLSRFLRGLPRQVER